MTTYAPALVEQAFQEWLNDLMECPEFQGDDAERICADLRADRTVMIIRPADHWPDDAFEGEGELSEYAIVTKGMPGLGLEESDDLLDLTMFCEQVGINYTLQFYETNLCASGKAN